MVFSATECLFCGGTAETEQPAHMHASYFDCPNCGKFAISGTAVATGALEAIVNDPFKRAVMSHYIFRNQGQKEILLLDSGDIKDIVEQETLPTPIEQTELLILLLGDRLKMLGVEETFNLWNLRARVGVSSINGMLQLFKHLDSEGLFVHGLQPSATVEMGGLCRLSIRGWEKYQSLKKGQTESMTAFMAMSFGQDKVKRAYEECFKPAALKCGFNLQLVNEEPGTGSIDDQIRTRILTSRFVVADLTGDNCGAYWEAGYGEGLGRLVFYTCEKSFWEDNKTHFDTNHQVTTIWDVNELGNAEDALKGMMRRAFPDVATMENSEGSFL